MANLQYQRDEHRVHLIVYHLVWTPKRRKAVLVGAIARECERLIRAKCQEQVWNVLQIAIQSDHVHLFVQVSPDVSASQVVKSVKGVTSRYLRRDFPQLKKLPSLWTRSFFAGTPGNVSSATIERYIEAQKGL